MPESWTGRLIGMMHNNGITMEQLGQKMGYGKPYISLILNSKRKPDGIRSRMESAVDELIKEKEENKT